MFKSTLQKENKVNNTVNFKIKPKFDKKKREHKDSINSVRKKEKLPRSKHYIGRKMIKEE